MISGSKNKALNSVIQHYIGESIVGIEEFNHGFFFETEVGKKGSLIRSIIGNEWCISIDGEIVDSIESEVFTTLIEPGGNYTLDQYACILHNLADSNKIKYRSKSLVSKILMILEDFMINSDEFVPKIPITIGANCIFSHGGIKFMYCLN